ncbi:hypothetical protein CIT32_05130 [Micrococcus luteus]|uniref:hypothetical protein n=1 Tax=Micrococcus luteus TaxID=1270 RepID=UPI000BACA0E6|nr:hypothetical protein [Micrococcus luteus]PAW32359.1 hypothetical protein CIT32_05130 [Micrococcus luteus]
MPAPSLGEEGKCAIQAQQPPLNSSNITAREHTGHLQTARIDVVARSEVVEVGGPGLMGVNGLPGTGKTTMLRDILASNVVERARRLSACENPFDALTERTHEWTGEGRMRRRARELRPEVAGLERVVASANNAAVENLSEEIPQRSAIKDGRHVDADYFACLATAAVGGSGGGRGRPG